MNPKDIERLHKLLDEQPEEPGTPLLDLIQWLGPAWQGWEWVWYKPRSKEVKPVDDLVKLENELEKLKIFRREIEEVVKSPQRRDRAIADKDRQIAYIKERIFTLRQSTAPQPKRGRPPGKASGSLSPVVEHRKGKTYPIVLGERVPKDLAHEYPEQFNWLYQWGEWCDRRERWITKSKRVPFGKVAMVRWHIEQRYPVKEILAYINGAI